jgi:hypothetical protein
MKRLPMPALAVACLFVVSLVSSPLSAQEESSETSARACLAVEETAPGGTGFPRVTVWKENEAPGPGKQIVLFADSSIDAYVIAAPFSAGGEGLANHWKPQFAELPAWQEMRLPVPPTAWNWETGAEPFELRVAFVEKNRTGIDEVKQLIEAMQAPQADENLLAMQARKLRETMDQWMATKDLSAFHAGALPSAWGGTLRGAQFPWRQMARKVAFDGEGRGFLTYPSTDKTE